MKGSGEGWGQEKDWGLKERDGRWEGWGRSPTCWFSVYWPRVGDGGRAAGRDAGRLRHVLRGVGAVRRDGQPVRGAVATERVRQHARGATAAAGTQLLQAHHARHPRLRGRRRTLSGRAGRADAELPRHWRQNNKTRKPLLEVAPTSLAQRIGQNYLGTTRDVTGELGDLNKCSAAPVTL